MKEKEKKHFDVNVVNEVPAEDRQSWISVMFVWMGTMICVTSILLGSELVSGMSLPKALLAGIIGYTAILGVTLLQGSQSSDLGRPTVVVAKPSFGSGSANYIFSFIIAIALIGWFGIQSTIAGLSVTELASLMGISLNVKVATVIIGIAMLINAVYGFKAMEVLNKITVPLMIIVIGWGTINVFRSTSISELWSYVPADGGTMSLTTGISVTFGSFVIGAVLAGDYTRFNRNRRDTIKSAAVGVVPLGFLLIICGALLAITAKSGVSDFVQVLTSNIPVPALALVTLILATWTTNVTNAYSAGIAIVNGLKLTDERRSVATLIAGIIGTALAVAGILDNFTVFLMILTAMVAPIAGVMIGDYWILNKGKKEGYMEQEASKWVGIVAWIVGCIPGVLAVFPKVQETVTGGNEILNVVCLVGGLFISMIIYIALGGGKKFN